MPAEAAVTDQLGRYLEQFVEARTGAGWLGEIQRAAIVRFGELGFPTTHDEDWKFTNLSALARQSFDPAPAANESVISKLHEALPMDEKREEQRAVFVNGRYAAALSTIGGSLREAPRDVLEQHLARYAEYQTHPFIALNTAFLDDGGFVYVPDGEVLERPIHLVHISISPRRAVVSHPRNLIVLGARSQAQVIETYMGTGEYFANAVTEIVAGESSVLEHCKLQEEDASAFHISAMHVQQARASVVTSRSIAFGGALARTEIYAGLEEGCECTLNGLYVVKGKQHVDTRTTIDHAKPHAASHELYKGILDGQSSAVFNGKIIVRKDAQKTDAKQTNKNLVLSEGATINTKPQLEIFADDVRCTHGATVGQLDPDSIFYLRSRGIDAEAAREMLTDAFAREVIDGIRSAPFRDYVARRLHDYRT